MQYYTRQYKIDQYKDFSTPWGGLTTKRIISTIIHPISLPVSNFPFDLKPQSINRNPYNLGRDSIMINVDRDRKYFYENRMDYHIDIVSHIITTDCLDPMLINGIMNFFSPLRSKYIIKQYTIKLGTVKKVNYRKKIFD